MKRGLFISLEGTDGSGKSTQLKLLTSYLHERGYDPLITREPGGTPLGEKIRDLLLDRDNTEIDYRTEALLYAAARAQHVFELIEPALLSGRMVVCDRFIDSSLAYQGYGRKLAGYVTSINEFVITGCMPDKTFLFKVDVETMRSRTSGKDRDRLECERAEFYGEVQKGYEELEKIYPERIIGIDGSGSEEAVHAAVIGHLDSILKGYYDI